MFDSFHQNVWNFWQNFVQSATLYTRFSSHRVRIISSTPLCINLCIRTYETFCTFLIWLTENIHCKHVHHAFHYQCDCARKMYRRHLGQPVRSTTSLIHIRRVLLRWVPAHAVCNDTKARAFPFVFMCFSESRTLVLHLHTQIIIINPVLK